MKILINSKLLAKKLSLIDFETDHVLNVRMSKSNYNRHPVLHLQTNDKIIDLPVDVIIRNSSILPQKNRRWDWVKRLVNETESQPVVLDITERNVHVIFSY